MKKKQKEFFLENEGDNWFERNIKNHIPSLKDPVIKAILRCTENKSNKKKKLLEIGCGDAKRLSWISENLKFQCYGIEPSKKAVKAAKNKGIKVILGTADKLKFEKEKFDFVVFGFCLYLCDREDLFQIAKEADRVLKNNGYLIIKDFYSKNCTKNKYHHTPGIFSYKMDYKKLFDWHPNYDCVFHEISGEIKGKFIETYTASENNWISISILKKKATI